MRIAAITSKGRQPNMTWVNDFPEQLSKLIYADNLSEIAGFDIHQFSSLEELNSSLSGFSFTEKPLYEYNPLSTLVTEMGPEAENGHKASRTEGKFTVRLFKKGEGFQLEIIHGNDSDIQALPDVQQCIDYAEENYYSFKEKIDQRPKDDRLPPPGHDDDTQYLDGRSILNPEGSDR